MGTSVIRGRLLRAYFWLAFREPSRSILRAALLAKERLASGVTFNPFLADYHADPYATYRRLRETDPVHWSELIHGWVLVRYADVEPALRDSRLSADKTQLAAWDDILYALGGQGPALELLTQSLVSVDPPAHTRLRGLVSQAFTPRVVETLRPRIEALTQELLDAAEQRPSIDLIRDIAVPLPVMVICELLGIPADDRALFRRWSDDLVAAGDPLGDPTLMRRADRAVVELADYLRPLIRSRRSGGTSDLIVALVAAEEDGAMLSEEEVYAMCILLLVAGNETTTNLIGNGILALQRQPDAANALRANPALAQPAIEELLRYDSPAQFAAGRVALEDIKIGGRQIRRGDFVFLCVGAANHDPAVFPHPERLDFTRDENHHLSFGHGIHYCLGAPLARLEGSIVIPAILQRWPSLRLAVFDPLWNETLTLRGLRALPVAI